MEENINDALGIAQENNNNDERPIEKTIDNRAENALTTIANIILILGICASLICFAMGLSWRYGKSFISIAVAALVYSVVSWSIMRVIANISLTLKEINEKIK